MLKLFDLFHKPEASEKSKKSPTRVAGGKKAAKKNKEYMEDFYEIIGEAGGKVKNPLKGFGTNRELAKVVGAIGGKKSKRGKTNLV